MRNKLSKFENALYLVSLVQWKIYVFYEALCVSICLGKLKYVEGISCVFSAFNILNFFFLVF